MGLDTSHGCWHGAYSSFTRWRLYLRQCAGLPPFGVEQLHDVMFRGAPLPEWYAGSPEDPLHGLLMHSDCDGEISVAEQLPLAARLEELAEKMPVCEGAGGHIFPDMKSVTLRFAAGLRAANAAGEPVKFH